VTAAPWLFLIYKMPPRPTSKRGALLRRLKDIGAVHFQRGACLLPKSDYHVLQLKMLESVIAERGGDSIVLEAVALDRSQEEKVLARFRADQDKFIGR
jgi:hypothetical protein